MPEPITNIEGIDARGTLIGWGALNQLGKWLMNADGQTWVESTRESAEESLRNAGAVKVRAGSCLE